MLTLKPRLCFMNIKWDFSDQGYKVYSDDGFQIIVLIQFIIFLLEITFQRFQYVMFLMPCIKLFLCLIKGQSLVRLYCKISRKGEPLERAISIFFCAFPKRFKGDFVASSLFSFKAFRYFCKYCGTVIRFIVSASFLPFFKKRCSQNFK